MLASDSKLEQIWASSSIAEQVRLRRQQGTGSADEYAQPSAESSEQPGGIGATNLAQHDSQADSRNEPRELPIGGIEQKIGNKGSRCVAIRKRKASSSAAWATARALENPESKFCSGSEEAGNERKPLAAIQEKAESEAGKTLLRHLSFGLIWVAPKFFHVLVTGIYFTAILNHLDLSRASLNWSTTNWKYNKFC